MDLLKLEGAEKLINECKPTFNMLQSFGPIIDKIDLQRGKHTCIDYKAESQVSFSESEPDWHQITEVINQERYTPNTQTGVTLYETAWEFAVELFCKMKLNVKNAYKAICNWSETHKAKLTMSKIHQLLSNARAASGGKSIPGSLWHTDRWIREKNDRFNWKTIMIESTQKLRDYINGNGWTLQNAQQKLALRQLNHWEDSRIRCGINYWFIGFDSPGLDGSDHRTFCKTSHACGSPACPECALWKTEQETNEWNWELAYGIQSPVVVSFEIGGLSGPEEMKLAVKKFAQRRSVKDLIDGCFGAFVPTRSGYSLKLMVPLERANQDGYIQSLTEKWSIVCRKLFNTHGLVTVSEPGLPAIELAVELVMSAERELFRLLAEDEISCESAWKWFSRWVGSKPGAKGMNRVFHAPGWRRYRIEIEDDHLPSNMEEGSLDGNSSSEEEVTPEPNYPRTWHSLESQVKKGRMLRAYDPYIQQEIYLEPGSGRIPPEYLDPKTMKPLSQLALPLDSRVQRDKTRLSDREIPLPANGPWEVKITIPDPISIWSPYSPEQRAKERGTWKGSPARVKGPVKDPIQSPSKDSIKSTNINELKKLEPAKVEDNRPAIYEQLTIDQKLYVEKKIDPDEESTKLILRMF